MVKNNILRLFLVLMILSLFSYARQGKAGTRINGPIPGLDVESVYLIYYGDWDISKIHYAEQFQLVIAHPQSNLDAAVVSDIRDGKDNILGTTDDVVVVAYVSVGEEHPGPVLDGDGRGPVTWDGEQLIEKNLGVASYYLDSDNDNVVDVNGTWKSYFVNAGDPAWHRYLKTRVKGLDYIFNELKCDGFFMDTIDSASPGYNYAWMLEGMADFIRIIREWYPESIMVANRGLFYFIDTEEAYRYNIRPYINAVMFESYFTSWDWEKGVAKINPWFETSHKRDAAPHINREAVKPDGFTVLCLDYLSPDQADYQEMLERQQGEVALQSIWLNSITDVLLKQCRNDVSGLVYEE